MAARCVSTTSVTIKPVMGTVPSPWATVPSELPKFTLKNQTTDQPEEGTGIHGDIRRRQERQDTQG